jgi:hypothetical protein
MKMKAHSDDSFPSLITIYKRIGNSKSKRAEKIRAYCAGKDEYEDIVTMCDDVSDNRDSEPEGTDALSSETNMGFVYLMKSGKYYKIGRSVSVGQRERQLAIQLPDKTATVHSIVTDDPVGIEAYWHKRFERKRKNGEWFDLDKTDINAFRRRKFM